MEEDRGCVRIELTVKVKATKVEPRLPHGEAQKNRGAGGAIVKCRPPRPGSETHETRLVKRNGSHPGMARRNRDQFCLAFERCRQPPPQPADCRVAAGSGSTALSSPVRVCEVTAQQF